MESTAPAPRGSAATVADPCPQCDGEEVVTRWVDDVMTWGSGDLKSRIPVYVPVRTCAACDLQYIDQHGGPRHAVSASDRPNVGGRQHAKVPTDRLVAHVTGLGEATIGRWENGLVIQNHANDRYLRLLAMPHVIRALQRRATIASQPG